jgi:hypothetical protein
MTIFVTALSSRRLEEVLGGEMDFGSCRVISIHARLACYDRRVALSQSQHRPTNYFDAAILFGALEKILALDLVEKKVGEEGRSYGISRSS